MRKSFLFLADGFEEVEALGVVDVLRRGTIEVKTVSISDKKEVTGAHGVPVVADLLLSDVKEEEAEFLICPGGMPGAKNLGDCTALVQMIQKHFDKGGYVAAICAAPALVLSKIKMNKRYTMTCYPGFEEYLPGAEMQPHGVVVDGNVAYTGGVNLADEYINAEQRFGYWKDAAIRLEGAAVWNFTVMFLNAWNAFRPQETDYTAFAPTRLPAVQDGVVQPYADSPLDEEPLAETVYLDILSQAQRYVYIYTPYLAVGEEMLDALKNAAKRGVDVRLILPGIPDKKLVFRLSRSYYLPLLRAGVRIYEFTPGFLHAKCYVSDDHVAVVGSINMDYRSMFLHFECGVLLLQNSQVLALRDDVRRTLPQCREVQCADCRTGLAGTVLDSVLRLLSPLM